MLDTSHNGIVRPAFIDGDSFTMKDHAGTTVTVDVNSSTTYTDPKVRARWWERRCS
jgi:hypothetical protein